MLKCETEVPAELLCVAAQRQPPTLREEAARRPGTGGSSSSRQCWEGEMADAVYAQVPLLTAAAVSPRGNQSAHWAPVLAWCGLALKSDPVLVG